MYRYYTRNLYTVAFFHRCSFNKDGCPVCDGIAPAGRGVRRNLLLLQRGHPLHVQVHSAEQSGGDYRCRICNGMW